MTDKATTDAPADGGQGGGAATTTDTNTGGDAGVSPPPPPPPEPFWKSLKNPELRGYAETKGWKGDDAITYAETVIDSYRNFEKLKGVPQERLLVLPENPDDAEAMKPVLAKLGMVPPEKADDYGFVTMEGVDPDFAKAAQDKFHELGIPPRLASALAQWQIEQAATMQATQEKEIELAVEADKATLRNEWGSQHDAQLERAKRVARVVGLTEDQIGALGTNVGYGYADTLKFFARIGDMIGESTFVRADNTSKGFDLSPDGARARLNNLMGNADWLKRFTTGDKAAADEASRLNRIIAGAPAEGAA